VSGTVTVPVPDTVTVPDTVPIRGRKRP